MRTNDKSRLMWIFKAVVKAQLRAKLRREKAKGFRADKATIEALEIALESDDLLEIQLSESVDKFEGSSSVNEVGDGTLLKLILDFLKSEEGQQLIKDILELIMALV